MTSVKRLRIEEPPTDDALGRGRFVFTDDYSVFDWGRMPDVIPDKGASLCGMSAFNFERLEADGIPTHYRGVVDADDDVVGFDGIAVPPREMAIGITRVPDLPVTEDGYDYDAYHGDAGSNYLIPLEIVFRNTVPIGSSLRGRRSPESLGLDIDDWPDEAVSLDEPVVEFSSKYEEQDRYLDRDEAAAIAGRADLGELERLAHRVNGIVTERAEAVGLEHHDGKIECLSVDGDVLVADAVGTFDENRFAYDGQQVSKEVVRQYYKRRHPDWVEAVAAAKTEATRRGVADWRELCPLDPPSLPEDVVETVGAMYAAGADAYTGRDLFGAPPLADAVDGVLGL